MVMILSLSYSNNKLTMKSVSNIIKVNVLSMDYNYEFFKFIKDNLKFDRDVEL